MAGVHSNDSWRKPLVPRFSNSPVDGYEAWAWSPDRAITCIEKPSPDVPQSAQSGGQANQHIDEASETSGEVEGEGTGEADWFIPDQFPYTHVHILELEDWPQRLLYIPTMTSHEWTPGNTYNGHVAPRYRAISYTWGRWRLRPGQKHRMSDWFSTRGKVLDAGSALPKPPGVPWEIPRVDAAHFTPDQLHRALTTVCNPRDPSLAPVDFVWLDLACIDQRRGPLSMLEVGRQAGIFARSEGVAIWLSHVIPTEAAAVAAAQKPTGKQVHPKRQEAEARKAARIQAERESLKNGLLLLQRAACETTLADISLRDLREVHWAVSLILSDPWWSSLWTLQEAMLGRHSFFILGDGMPLRVDTSDICTLQWLTHTYHQAVHKATAGKASSRLSWSNSEPWVTVKTQADGEARRSMAWSLIEWFDAAAISAMATPDGLADVTLLLTNAARRYASLDTDHIYGIQQVFGYQLGSSRPGISPRQRFSRRSLEDEMGALMLRDNPVRSQLFMFVQVPMPGRSWHVNQACHVHPELAVPRVFQTRYEPSTRTLAGVCYGHFKGRVCPFSNINRRWDAMLEEGWHVAAGRGESSATDKEKAAAADPAWKFSALRRFYPDIVHPLLLDSEERRETEGAFGVHIPDENDRQVRFGRYLERKFRSNRLVVLHLGCSSEKQFGLLLVQVRVKPANVVFWYRLGLVVWYFGCLDRTSGPNNVESPGGDMSGGILSGLDGTGLMWQDTSGLFG